MQPCINENKITNIENKVNQLEKVNMNQNRSIDDMAAELRSLTKKLELLIDILVKVGYTTASLMIMTVISMLAYLIVYWVKG